MGFFCFFVFYDEGREDPNTHISVPSLTRQQNTMAFCWRADDGQTLNASLVGLWLFRGFTSEDPLSPPLDLCMKYEYCRYSHVYCTSEFQASRLIYQRQSNVCNWQLCMFLLLTCGIRSSPVTTAMLRSVLALLHTSFKAAAQDRGFTPPALLITFTPNKAGKILQITFKARKRAKIRNPYNQTLHLTQDTNAKVTTSQLDITNKSKEVSPFKPNKAKQRYHNCRP